MCGIIGIISQKKNAVKEVYEGLSRLEYRGYDSAGLSVLSGGKITTVKAGGRVSALEEGIKTLSGTAAIGHTRWATHGEPSDRNAHPHVSGGFSLVHNGIIENYAALKEELAEEGAEFLSDTDSEVIVKLIDRYFRGDPLEAVRAAVERLKGSYALAVMCEGREEIIAVKYKSPAVIGFWRGGVCVCSDVPALPGYVTSIAVPEDGDIVSLRTDSAVFYNARLQPVNRVRRHICAGQYAAGLGEWRHYMIKEIHETARTLTDTCEGFFRAVDCKKLGEYLRSADRIIICGCGTAYNSGLVAKEYFNAVCGAFCQVEIASELRYSQVRAIKNTLVLAVSQSGETADTVEAAAKLKADGARVVAVTNCGYSAITRIAHLVVPVCAGAEVCVAATKSYIGQLAALRLIASLSGDTLSVKEQLLKVADSVEGVFKGGENAEKIAALCAEASAVFFLGRGIDYAVAVEASLKLKEITYKFSDGYPAGELKHGTLALIDENTLSVLVICDERIAAKCENAASQIISRKGKVAVITCLDDVAERLKASAEVWKIPQASSNFSPFLSAVALQLIAYKTAVKLGRDPDKPRNLAKSVTVE